MRRFLASRRCVAISRRSIALGFVLLAGLVPSTRADEPRPNPQRYIPARGLVAYIEFDGLRAHANAWEATAAYAMLAKTPAGAMMTDLARQIIDRLLKMAPGVKLTGAELIALQDHLVAEGFAVGLHRHGDDVDSWTIVINGAGRKGSRERFERFLEFVLAPEPPAKLPAPIRLRDRDVHQLKHLAEANREALPAAPAPLPGIAGVLPAPAGPLPGQGQPAAAIPWLSWWFEKDDLVLISMPLDTSSHMQDPATGKRFAEVHTGQLTAVLDAFEGKQANVTTHPGYVAAISEGKDIKGFESDGLFFIDSGSKGGLFGRLLEGPAASPLSMLGVASVPEPAEVPAGPGYLPGVAPAPVPIATAPDGVVPPASPADVPATAPTEVPPLAVVAELPPAPTPPVARGIPGADQVPLPRAADGAVRPSPSSVIPAPSSPSPRPVRVPTVDEPRAAPVDEEPKAVPPREAGQVAAVKKEPDPLEVLGLDGVKRIVGRWGFQGKALLTDVRIEAPVPRRGLVAWLDQPAFDKDHLPPIPRATHAFIVDSFDPAVAYGRFTDLAKKVEPEMGGLIDQMERSFRDVTGLRLGDDILSHLGPTWCILPVPSAEGGGDRKAELDPGEYVLVASLKDADGFAKSLDTLAAKANQYFRDRERTNDDPAPGGRQADPPMLALERLPAPHRGYRLTSPSRLVFWLNEDVQPTILVGKGYIAFAVNAERAAGALAFEQGAGGRWRPTGELVSAFECLPAKLTFLSIGDSRDSAVPDAIAQLPSIVQLLATSLGGFGDPAAAMSTDLLTLVGVPGPGSFRLRIDPARIPKAEELRSHLFPSVLAAAVDDRGIRVISREAFPFACVGNRTYVKSGLKWSGSTGLKRDVTLGLGRLGVR